MPRRADALLFSDLGRCGPRGNAAECQRYRPLDRSTDWRQNYRIPDVFCFCNGTAAIDCGSHLLGGPETPVEIVSRGENPLDKFDFYASVGVRDLLVIERNPWRLTLHANATSGQPLQPTAVSTESDSQWIELNIMPVHRRIDAATGEIQIKCNAPPMNRRWAYR